MRADWIVPDWPAPPQVRAICTTRDGGVSTGAYLAMNLGSHVGDAASAVARNRALLASAIQAQPVFLEQVHGTALVNLDDDVRIDDSLHDDASPRADGCFTTRPGLACTVMVADCLPVLFCDRAGTRVAAAHAGWRGLAAGVLEQAVAVFGAGNPPLAWLGPCIGPQAFEVGNEVKRAFESEMPDAARCFKPSMTAGKWLADLPALARQRLQACGVESIHGNDSGPAWCTAGDPSRFFSHRRDRGISGRFAACVWLG